MYIGLFPKSVKTAEPMQAQICWHKSQPIEEFKNMLLNNFDLKSGNPPLKTGNLGNLLLSLCQNDEKACKNISNKKIIKRKNGAKAYKSHI